MRKRVVYQRGLTLVELLLASALATVLMVGVLAVVTNLTMTERALNPLRGESNKNVAMALEELDAWAAVLRGDLNHAGRIHRLQGGEIELVTYQSLQGEAREAVHRPVLVRYEMETINERSWVVRRQSGLDGGAAGTIRRSDLVGMGVKRFELVPTGYGGNRRLGESGATSQITARESVAAEVLGGSGKVGATRVSGTLLDLSEYQRAWHQQEGQWLVIENAPPWIKAIRPDMHGRPSTETTGEKLKSAQADEQHWGAELISEVVPGGFVWRLQVWMDDAAVPTYERILTIQ